jgi:hypothetical protein
MWTVAVTFFMFGVFLLGFFFGILFGVWVADKLKEEASKVGKKRFG